MIENQMITIDDLYNRSDDWKLKRFSDLDDETKSMVVEWITSNLKKRKTINRYKTVYWIKHALQSQTGIYLTESQFAEALLICGFLVVKTLQPCHVMQTNVADRAPAFTSKWKVKV